MELYAQAVDAGLLSHWCEGLGLGLGLANPSPSPNPNPSP